MQYRNESYKEKQYRIIGECQSEDVHYATKIKRNILQNTEKYLLIEKHLICFSQYIF